MKNFALFVVLLPSLASVAFGSWAPVPLNELVRESDLIVIGTLHSANEDYDGIGRGYILVERIVSGKTRTLNDKPLEMGESVKIRWADNWACASGMHMGRRGKRGVWLLQVEDDHTVSAAYPGRFLDSEKLSEIYRLVGENIRSNKVVETLEVSDTQIENERYKSETPQAIEVDLVVATSEFSDYKLSRAATVLLLAFVLYSVLYRSRFRIR